MTEPTTPIYLTDDDAQYFVQCQKYRAKISILLANKFFDRKSENVKFSFNKDGKIETIDIHSYVHP